MCKLEGFSKNFYKSGHLCQSVKLVLKTLSSRVWISKNSSTLLRLQVGSNSRCLYNSILIFLFESEGTFIMFKSYSYITIDNGTISNTKVTLWSKVRELNL